MKTENAPEGFASIEFKPEKIHYGYTSYYKQSEDRFSVFVPAFGLFLSVKNMEEMQAKTRFMVKSFFNFHLINGSIRNFMLEIHKMGFRTKNHDLIMKQTIAGRPTNSKFKLNSNVISPKNFNMDEAQHLNIEEEIAC